MTSQTDTPSSSYASPTSRWTYDVFLSFRGEDTRRNFTDHLYAALNRKGIFTFRDDEQLEIGQAISPALLQAMEESRFVIVILSRNYASSTWCLDELAKAVECMQVMGQTLLPVFYDVDPSEVRKQTGSFGKAFSKHEKAFENNIDKVQRWRAALCEVANLSGWNLQDGYESKVIQDIVGNIFTKVNQTISSVSTDLVGMDSRVKEMLSYLDTGLSKVCMIGIWGMGGIGKTTIAQVVFERIRSQFEAYSFLANVRETTEKQGLLHLQKLLLSDILLDSQVNIHNIDRGINMIRQRLRNKLVLIILDDVDQLEQLEALCGHGWFGSGSRIIITSRDEHLLRTYGVDKIYKAKALTEAEALQLFSWKAFKKDQVGEDLLELSRNVLEYANGLPLAIKVLGSFLFGRSLEEWLSALDSLQEYPDKEIINVLKVSFDSLQHIEKKVFLDIACFFKGEDKDRVTRILESSCGYRPDIDIAVLVEKSLVNLFEGKLWVHDLIQELGWEIVRRECDEEPGKRTRLWLPKDIIRVLVNNEGTIAVEGIVLNLPKEEVVHLNVDPFSSMRKLRFLRISNVKFSGYVKYLSNELQLLEWHACPLGSFPSNFQSDKLVELSMHSSSIKQLWSGNKRWSMLQFIDLSGSKYLIKTPNFTEAPNIVTLVLQDCTRLVEVHPSIGVLKKLSLLNMRNCKCVESLPASISLESLEIFNLSACSKLKKFPEIEGNMESLLELYLDGTAIEELPSSIERFSGLTLLKLQDCKNLLRLPSSIQYLTSLKTLNLSGCSELDEMPANLNCVECLERLDISGTAIRESSSIVDMKNLKFLSFQGCKDLPPNMWHSLFNCWWWGIKRQAPMSLLLPTSFSGLSSLTKLNLSDCSLTEGAIPSDLGSLFYLEILNLSGNRFVDVPESICQLSNLKSLNLSHCSRLQSLPRKLPLSVKQVNADGCTSLIDFPSQFKIWASNVSGMTTISRFLSSRNQEYLTSSRSSKLLTSTISSTVGGVKTTTVGWLKSSDEHQEWKPVAEFSMPTQVLQKDIELLDFTASPYQSVSEKSEIPEWFTDTATGEFIAIPLSSDLNDDKKCIGVALCAVFSVKDHPAVSSIELDSETSDYFYQCKFGTLEFVVEPLVFDTKEYRNLVRSSSHFLSVFYVPCLAFREMLNKSSAIWALFETDNPCMKVQKCGIRLVYEQDVAGFIQTTMQDTHGGFQHEIPSQDGCNPVEVNKARALEYGWFNLVDNILIWEKFPTAKEGSTILLRRNIESLLPRYLEGLNHSGQFFQFCLSGTPAWFNPQIGSSVSIQLPKNLYKNKKWMGVALCASLAVLDQHKVIGGYNLFCRLSSGNVNIEMSLCSANVMRDKSQLWVMYIPRSQLPEWFSRSSSSSMVCRTLFRIDNAGVEVQICGCRVFYQQDLKGFVQTITHCILRCPDTLFEGYNNRIVRDWLTLIRLQGLKIDRKLSTSLSERQRFQLILGHYRNQDWSMAECRFRFPGIEIPMWFMHLNKGGSAQIQLPPNLFDDANWMGIAACAYASIHEHPTVILNTPDSEFSRELFCYLDTNLANVRLRGGEHTDKAFWLHACDFTWFVYAPRAKFSGSLNQCNLVRATFGSNSPGLGLHQCALRLVFKEDVEDLAQTLTFCQLSAKHNHSRQAKHGNQNMYSTGHHE